MEGSADFLLEFWECCIHAVLYNCKIYPPEIFEERILYDIPVFQSRHPDVCSYIKRVLDNARPIVEAGFAEKLVIEVVDGHDRPLYHISFDYSLGCQKVSGRELQLGTYMPSSEAFSADSLHVLQEELRSSLLQLVLSCGRLPVPPEGCTWNIGLVTSARVDAGANSRVRGDCVNDALKSGQWLVDNDGLPERLASASIGAGNSSSDASGSRTCKILPVKKFAEKMCSCNIYIHIHNV
jgi:hypothetical protein